MAEEVVVQPKALEEASDASPAASAQEEADREFALKLSQRLNDSPSIPAATAATADPVAASAQAKAAEASVDEDYQLALRLSQELNEGSPAVIVTEQGPAPIIVQIPASALAPAPAPALTQEEIDRRLALELEQALNVDETTDREVAFRISQQLNQPAPPPPVRAAYPTLTPGGPMVSPALPYVQQRSAEEIRVEAEIARATRSLSNPENDADTKVALELQLQELVAYQRQLQRRRIRTEEEEPSGPQEDFIEDGLEMLNEGYEKFKESSKDIVKKIDVYGGKVEQTLRSWFSKLIPSTTPEESPASPSPSLVSSSSAGGDEALEGDDEDQPLSRGNLRRRAPRPPSVEGAAFTPTTTPIGERHSNVEKGFSFRLVEKLDQVTDEIGSTVVDLLWGDKSTSPTQPAVASSASPASPESSVPTTTTTTTTTTSSSTTTEAPARVDLPDFKGGNAKDGDDMFAL